MKTLSLTYDTNRILFVVNNESVSLAAFLKSPESYESSAHLEAEFKARIFYPESVFRKLLRFSEVVDLNIKLKGKDFLPYLETLKDYGLKVNKSGLKPIE